MRKSAPALAAFLVSSCLAAQSSPFVDEKVERLLVDEISGDLAFETLRITTQWHKPGGSEGFFAVARYVEEHAKTAGLKDVRWIDQVADSPSWTCRRAEAWLIEGDGDAAKRTKLGSYAEVATSIADYSRPADVTAQLVDVGTGEKAADYEGRDVRGKVVLASGNVGTVMEQAVWKRGAAGILSWSSSRLNPLAEGADQIAWVSAPQQDGPNGEKTTFAFVVSRRAGNALSDRIRGDSARRWGGGGATESAKGLRVQIVVDQRNSQAWLSLVVGECDRVPFGRLHRKIYPDVAQKPSAVATGRNDILVSGETLSLCDDCSYASTVCFETRCLAAKPKLDAHASSVLRQHHAEPVRVTALVDGIVNGTGQSVTDRG